MSVPIRLAISLHDVAPHTWPACERLLAAVDAVARVPVTLLVVPDHHFTGLRSFTPDYRRALEARLARGDELALHGWTHLDTCPLNGGVIDTLRRTLLTASEGEFAALPARAAHALLQEGVEWFEKQGWPLHGFVAPAWLLGPGAWHALARFPFEYTTTREHVHLLPQHLAVPTRTFVYSVRSRMRRGLSLARNETLRQFAMAAPAVRLALHPADAAHQAILHHCQLVLRTLLERGGVALTKAELCRQLRRVAGVQ